MKERELNEGVKPSSPKPDLSDAYAPFLARGGQTGQIFSIPFAFGQNVNIDGHTDIKAIVTGFAFYPHNSEVRVEWFANGDAKLAWIGAGRLTLAQ